MENPYNWGMRMEAAERKRKPQPVESHVLPGMEEAVTEQAAAAGEYQGEELSAFMLTPIEPKPRGTATPEEMEKKAPLFFGTTYSKLF